MVVQQIRPVSDLRNHFADISRSVHESEEPVFLTKNGFGDMVVMSMEAYENRQYDSQVYSALLEAEREEGMTDQRFSPKEALRAMRSAIGRASEGNETAAKA
ncbi:MULTISPECIES: type II toxin-antitoxin system Phd/YefM family antitoxin [unclassified Bifidobacterium]|uniref:type II toxin-antitoxin system Phd/YefM family antitoxin n=1 Tax=unclassified Bifidobacterium TaxID=2608897 RepID=UPI0023F88661|nr:MULTISPECIES: type II toxin-antitoxin system Phd/YefM family antitoxin [unclassified Bifidobacterium]WEV65771.1 type II toxin-antitoxin system Phd/YefM family antitoxin [Bifidobacterium sp. ESL0764]WEV75442.1 type II toxin-antitoxin system Phd/YefM family antitoxin [Bifidobacterium sp. ESL0800]